MLASVIARFPTVQFKLLSCTTNQTSKLKFWCLEINLPLLQVSSANQLRNQMKAILNGTLKHNFNRFRKPKQEGLETGGIYEYAMNHFYSSTAIIHLISQLQIRKNFVPHSLFLGVLLMHSTYQKKSGIHHCCSV